MSAFIGTIVDTQTLGVMSIRHNQLLIVNEKGIITHLEDATTERSKSALERLSCPLTKIAPGSFLLPTFCDLHLHAPQFLYLGNGLHLPLMQWLDEYAFKAEERLDSDPNLAMKVYKRLGERLIENGTGTVLLFGTIKSKTNLILASAMQQAGIRAYVGKLSMDISTRPSYVESSASFSLEAAESFVSSCRSLVSHLPQHSRYIEPVLTPRFVPTCSDSLLCGLGELSKREALKVQSHLAEAADQVKWVRQERGKEDIDVFSNANLLTPRTVQAHCTFLDVPSLDFLRNKGTSIAHCPLSNSYFSAKPFPLREALGSGVKVGLGTDVAGGYSPDVMSAMRQSVIVSRMREGDAQMNQVENPDKTLSIDWKESLFLATRGGCEALDLLTGQFREGVPFDAQQIRVYDPDTRQGVGALDFFDNEESSGLEGLVLSDTVVEKWWCLGDHRNRDHVWIQGERRL